ncbi:HipA family kinase [Granulicella sibirica]|uniref:HipA-like kinase domain-containing protein n=1 Tax=Granulicella sibirica TaxID=2479048 RepID=A0A4Q0T985_9BACT|nr:HipA family kinase [Granulicella sibirica]RXH58678.1 hypothetical protein GRAN_1988 [Granulicella sibirica]
MAESLRTIQATRYVTPLREGGSLPAIIEAADLGLYVLKFRGAGQGPLALVAELVAGEIGRTLGLRVPELVLVEVEEALGRNEPDQEIRDLLKRSVGLNLAMDFLPGATMFDLAAGDRVDPTIASLAVWFDAFVTNVDRTARNPNLLVWHHNPWFIDHGAALYFQHQWRAGGAIVDPAARFAAIKQHVLLPAATSIRKADQTAKTHLNESAFRAILELVPDTWLLGANLTEDPKTMREAYTAYFTTRLSNTAGFVEEAEQAHADLV